MPRGSSKQRQPGTAAADDVVVAVPKGRVLEPLARVLASAGLKVDALAGDDRRLVRSTPGDPQRFLLLKPDDVPTYVEYGAADLGVVGRDVLIERGYDVYVPVDLGIGVCRLVVAGVQGTQVRGPSNGRPLRIATKFPNVATRYFQRCGIQAEMIYVQGSVELAPLTGLSDLIVDLVETGETLERNGLVVLEEICPITTVVVANRASLKLKRTAIDPLLRALREAAT